MGTRTQQRDPPCVSLWLRYCNTWYQTSGVRMVGNREKSLISLPAPGKSSLTMLRPHELQKGLRLLIQSIEILATSTSTQRSVYAPPKELLLQTNEQQQNWGWKNGPPTRDANPGTTLRCSFRPFFLARHTHTPEEQYSRIFRT